MNNKRPAEHREEKNTKRIKLNETAVLLPLREQAEALLKKYKDITVEAFKERLIHQYKLVFLQELLKTFDCNASLEALKAVLENNWHKFKNSIVCYTALPEDEVTLLACDIAQLISDEIGIAPLSVLMPGLCVESIKDEYPDLGQPSIQIKEVIKTHVISQCGGSLIPIKVLLDIKLNTDTNKKMHKPYYDLSIISSNADDYFLNKETFERLYLHSAITRALRDTQLSYENLSVGDQSLYSHLFRLCNKLYLNSSDGLGSEENAGADVYSAIIEFNDYYQQIDPESIKVLPEVLQEEINKIIDYSSDKTININATETMESCIATRRDLLSKAIKGHEAQLLEISISSENKSKLINELKNTFEICKKELKQALKNDYCGVDEYAINKSLITELKVKPCITQMKDVTDLLSLNVDELHEIIESNEKLASEIVYLLADVEQLIMFFINTSPEKLRVVLPQMRDKLIINGLVGEIDNVIACLITLESEKLQVVSNFLLGEKGCTILGKLGEVEHIEGILEALSLEQRVIVFNEIKKTLKVNYIKNIYDFYFINHLPLNECLFFLEDIKKHFFSLLNPGRLAHFLGMLAPERRKAIFPFFKKYISTQFFYKDIKLLGYYLDSIPIEQGLDFIRYQKESWFISMIHQMNLPELFRLISPEKREIIFSEFINRVDIGKCFNAYGIISQAKTATLGEFCILLEQFEKFPKEVFEQGYFYNKFICDMNSAEKIEIFFDKTINHIKMETIFEDANDLSFMQYLNIEQYAVSLKKIKHVIKNSDDFDNLTKNLSYEKSVLAFNEVRENMGINEIIKNPFCSACYLNLIDGKNNTGFLEGIFAELLKTINDPRNLDVFVSILSPSVRPYVFDEINHFTNISSLFQSSMHFVMLKHLSLDECESLLSNIKENWPNILTSSKDLFAMFSELDEDRCKSIFNSFREYIDLENMISDLADLCFIVSLPERERTYVLKSIDWNKLILTPNDFEILYFYDLIGVDITNVRNEILTFALKQINMTELVKSFNDLCFLAKISVDDIKLFLEKIKEHWSNIIIKAHDFKKLFETIDSLEVNKIIYNEAKKYLDIPNLIKDEQDLHFINYLDAYNLDLILESVKDRWAVIFKTVESFRDFIESLHFDRRKLILDEIRNNDFIIDIVKDFNGLAVLTDSLTREEYDMIHEKIGSRNLEPQNLLLFSSRQMRDNNNKEEDENIKENIQHRMQF